jgi:hypothetical protein
MFAIVLNSSHRPYLKDNQGRGDRIDAHQCKADVDKNIITLKTLNVPVR